MSTPSFELLKAKGIVIDLPVTAAQDEEVREDSLPPGVDVWEVLPLSDSPWTGADLVREPADGSALFVPTGDYQARPPNLDLPRMEGAPEPSPEKAAASPPEEGQALTFLPREEAAPNRQLQVTQGIRVDAAGVPILDQDVEVDPLVERLTGELREQLPALVQEAFVAAVKLMALELKNSFERRLEHLLDERLDELVADALRKAKPGPPQ